MSEPQDRPSETAASGRSQLEQWLEEARRILPSDWRAAGALAQKALELEPSNLVAKSIRTMANERKREEDVASCFAAVRQLRAAKDLKGALAEADRCLAEYPLEPRLIQLREVVAKEYQAAAPTVTPPVEAPPPPPPPPTPPPPPELPLEEWLAPPPPPPPEDWLTPPAPFLPPTTSTAAPIPPPTQPFPVPQPPLPPPPQKGPAAKPAGGLWAALSKRPGLVWGLSGAVTAVAAIIIAVVVFTGTGPRAPAAVAVEVHTTPPGAAIRINNQERGRSSLKLELIPGTYQVEALLEGYQPASAALEVKPVGTAPLELMLQPLAQTVRIVTDLEAAQVTLDEQPAEAMQEGQLTLSSLPAGAHSIKVADRYGEASFAFQITPGAAPAVAAPPSAKSILAVLVSQAGNRAVVHSSLPSAKLALDGQPVGEAGPAGLELANLTPGTHELTVGEGRDLRKFLLEVSPSPSLTAYLQSDRNVGTLVVVATEDSATVFLDGQRYPSQTRRGQLRITRAPKHYRVKIAKEGFLDEPEQTVEVRKGEEVRVAFKLRPAPRLASLAIRGATPGAEVLVDQISLGAVGADGAFRSSSISPGEHVVELRKERHRPAQVQRVFPVGTTVELHGPEVSLRPTFGTLRLTVSPPGARVTASRAGESPRNINSGAIELDEGSWTLVGRAAGHLERAERVQIAAGQTVPLELALTREPTRPPPVKIGGMEGWENPQNWIQEGNSYVRRGRVLALHGPTPAGGMFTLTLALASGGGWLRGKRLRWVVDFRDERNHVLFELDKESLRRSVFVRGRKTEIRRQHRLDLKDELAITLQVEVTPTTVTHRARQGEGWVDLDSLTVPGQNFTVGQFGINIEGRDEVRLTDFSFRPGK